MRSQAALYAVTCISLITVLNSFKKVIQLLPVRVFYHVYIPADPRAQLWSSHVDQQLGMISSSGLKDVARVEILITMPMHWSSMFGTVILANGNTRETISFAAKVREYICTRYPWASIVEMRDSSENQFEAPTLRRMWQESQKQQFVALYIHTKGSANPSESVLNWRDILNYYHIHGWKRASELLQHYQVLSLEDSHSQQNPIVSGNFFWSTSDYLRTLADPARSELYTTNPDVWPGAALYRYAFELWILSGKPLVYSWADTNVNHYFEYCFLEDLLHQYPLE